MAMAGVEVEAVIKQQIMLEVVMDSSPAHKEEVAVKAVRQRYDDICCFSARIDYVF